MKLATKQSDLIYDVGMHKGEDTEFYLGKGFKVIAFEADPELVEYNKCKFSDNIKKKELVIVEGAIIDKPVSKTVTFYKSSWSVFGTVNIQWAKRNEGMGATNKPIEVEVVDFSKCIKKYGIPYYMKIYIEGTDIVCLKSLLQFAHKPDYISIESDKTSYESVLEEIGLLEELGYSEFMAVQQENIFVQKLPSPPKEGSYYWHMFRPGSSGLFGKELPGKWLSKQEVLEEYRTIFNEYRRFGDGTFWQRNKAGLKFLEVMSLIRGKPIPGWYDTHARHFGE